MMGKFLVSFSGGSLTSTVSGVHGRPMSQEVTCKTVTKLFINKTTLLLKKKKKTILTFERKYVIHSL